MTSISNPISLLTSTKHYQGSHGPKMGPSAKKGRTRRVHQIQSSSDAKYFSPSLDESYFLVFLSLNIIKCGNGILILFPSFQIPFLDFVLVVGWKHKSNFEMTSPQPATGGLEKK